MFFSPLVQKPFQVQVIFYVIFLRSSGILVREAPGAPASKMLEAHVQYLRYSNGTIQNFSSCSSACQQCFLDHFQACLAYCQKGCQEYCEEKLSDQECKDQNPDELWVAEIGSLFDVMSNPSGRMCQFNAPDGCPELGEPSTTVYPLPSAPYFNEAHPLGIWVHSWEVMHDSQDLGLIWYVICYYNNTLLSWKTLANAMLKSRGNGSLLSKAGTQIQELYTAILFFVSAPSISQHLPARSVFDSWNWPTCGKLKRT